MLSNFNKLIVLACGVALAFSCSSNTDELEVGASNPEETALARIKENFIANKYFYADWDFDMDVYTIKTDLYGYEVALDLTECDFSEFTASDEIKIPYCVYKDSEIIYSDSVIYDKMLYKQGGGILLSFDDYFACWNTYLPYFTDYGIRATFFCFGNYSRFGTFANKAQNAGLEIGYHTLGHLALTMVDSEEEFKEQAISPLPVFRDKYVYLDSFAFPNGLYLPYQVDMLLDYYKILRLFDNHFRLYSMEEIARQRVIFSQSIDKNQFSDTKDFKNKIVKRIILAQITGEIYPCTTHYILTEDGEIESDAFTISKENLVWLFETINALNCKTYCYKDIYTYMY